MDNHLPEISVPGLRKGKEPIPGDGGEKKFGNSLSCFDTKTLIISIIGRLSTGYISEKIIKVEKATCLKFVWRTSGPIIVAKRKNNQPIFGGWKIPLANKGRSGD